MARIFFIVCLLVTWGCKCCAVTALEISLSSTPSPSPSPSGDCSEIIYNLVDCLDFLANGSNDTKPNSNCCSGFESVVSTNATCICEAIMSSSNLGMDLNMTKAFTLPSACGISAPPFTTCGVTPPSPSPSKESPTQSPSSPKKSPAPSPPSPEKSPIPPLSPKESLTPPSKSPAAAPSPSGGETPTSAPTPKESLTPLSKSPAAAPPSGGETPTSAPIPSLNNGVACGRIAASIKVFIISMLVLLHSSSSI